MIVGLIYRCLYREEIRERRERGAAIAEVWRARQVENQRRWEAQTERMRDFRERAKTMSPDEIITELQSW